MIGVPAVWLGRCGPVIAVALLVLAFAVPASAVPKGIFGVFAGCPLSDPRVALCVDGQAGSGAMTIGGTTVPISNTITIQAGAVHVPGPELNEYDLVPPQGGVILSRAEQRVPGGLAGLIRCGEIGGASARTLCGSIFERGATGVTATIELAASETYPVLLNMVAAAGVGSRPVVTFPVRLHLNNPLLGSGCYVGSRANPIQLKLTAGTTSPPAPNKPIEGILGELSEEEENLLTLLLVDGSSFVDNAFAIPAAEGCGGQLGPFIDPLLDRRLGLPAKAGHSSAILVNTIRIGETPLIRASEK